MLGQWLMWKIRNYEFQQRELSISCINLNRMWLTSEFHDSKDVKRHIRLMVESAKIDCINYHHDEKAKWAWNLESLKLFIWYLHAPLSSNDDFKVFRTTEISHFHISISAKSTKLKACENFSWTFSSHFRRDSRTRSLSAFTLHETRVYEQSTQWAGKENFVWQTTAHCVEFISTHFDLLSVFPFKQVAMF